MMRFYTILVLLLFGCISAFSSLVSAQDILVVRPLNNSRIEVESELLLFEAEISAFDPITEVKLNGEALPIQSNTFVSVSVPLRLQRGANRVIIDAATEFGTAREEFVINLKLKGKPVAEDEEIPPFNLISMAGMQSVSNPLSLPKDDALLPSGTTRRSGTKTFLIFIPTYDLVLNEANTLQMQGIISREKYDHKDFESVEIAFTQGTASWIQTFAGDHFWKAGVGYSIIDQTYDGLFSGKTHLEDDSLVFGEMNFQVHPEHMVGGGLQILNKNMAMDAEDPDFEGDATVTTLKGLYLANVGFLQLKAGIEQSETDAIGKFVDESSTKIAGEASYLAGDFIFTAKLSNQETTLTEPDPVTGIQTTKTRNSSSLVVNYLLTDSWIINVDYTAESQSSNQDLLKYDNTVGALAVIYLYQ